MVYDGTQGTALDRCKFYLDGSLKTHTNTAGTFPTTLPTMTTEEFGLNNYEDTGASNLAGNMDEVAIFDVALSSAEVSSLYNSGAPTNVEDFSQTPRHYWQMGDNGTYGSGIWNIPDVMGNGDMDSTNMEEGDRNLDTP